MRCSICGKSIYYDLSFKDLFVFDFVCKECTKRIEPKYTVIPLENGYLIKYYYFVTEEEYIPLLEYKVYNAIYEIIKKESKKSLIYFLNDDFIVNLKYLNFKENITLISVIYEDLSIIESE